MQLARIDGDTSETELKLIQEIGASKFVSRKDMDMIFQSTSNKSTIPSLEAMTEDEKIDLITNLVMVMRADGRIELREMTFCFDVVNKIGFPETRFFNLVVGVFDQGDLMEREVIRKYVETGFRFA
ncbi:hypothetical protein [Fulvivirga sedimenti]|uniref:TerB family tellurite resistance protein n=1 Tax=Fulvivirga sedimenti TaxID=2879465 RepID=A0A9X1L0K2_9BACT|nr:hypothetical protein [Fulvivirga sedimenti]MCA6077914.1 hypothetical protein [Fulvivirga sedimenti]